MEQFLLGSLSRGFHFCNFFHAPPTSWPLFWEWPGCALQARDAMQILYVQIVYPANREFADSLCLQILQGYKNICKIFLLVCHSPCSCSPGSPSHQSCWASFPCPSCCSRCALTFPMKRRPRDGLALSVQGCEKLISQSI